jgi:hypothetical protein
MMRKFFFFLLVLFSTFCFGQKDTTHIAKNTFYIEVEGNGLLGSINYERLIYNEKSKSLSLRIGFLPFYEKSASFIAVPLECCAFFGDKHFLDIGLGLSYYHGLSEYRYNPQIQLPDHMFGGLYFIPRIGYRFQKANGGFFLRLDGGALIKLVELYKYNANNVSGGLLLHSPFTIGLSLGYTIKK